MWLWQTAIEIALLCLAAPGAPVNAVTVSLYFFDAVCRLPPRLARRSATRLTELKTSPARELISRASSLLRSTIHKFATVRKMGINVEWDTITNPLLVSIGK